MSFSIPPDEAKAAAFIEEAMGFLFKLSEVEAFAKKHHLAPISTQPKQGLQPENKSRKLTEFDKKLQAYAEQKQKKNPRLSVPAIARQALINQEDFLYLLKPGQRQLPKQETIEKHLRTILKTL